MNNKIISMKPISLKEHDEYDEGTVEDFIFENPNELGLGDLKVIERQRVQFTGRRLDLLLGNINTRYCTELQLGKLDGDHIYRGITYTMNEEDIYPQHDYCTVLMAEKITKENIKFLCEFNREIIAFEISAYEINGNLGLSFKEKFNNRRKIRKNKKQKKTKKIKNQTTLETKNNELKTMTDLHTELINQLSKNENIELIRVNKNYTRIYKKDTNTIIGSIQDPYKTKVNVHIYIEKNDDEEKLTKYLEGKGINGKGNHEFEVTTEKDINYAMLLINKAYNKPKETIEDLTKEYTELNKKRRKQ